MKSYDVTIQMRATEQYFPVVLFIMLYNVVLTFESVDEILWCDHSNESYRAVLSCGAVYYAVQCGSNFWVRGWNPMMWPFKWKLLSSTFLWYCLLCCTKVINEVINLWMKSLREAVQIKHQAMYATHTKVFLYRLPHRAQWCRHQQSKQRSAFQGWRLCPLYSSKLL